MLSVPISTYVVVVNIMRTSMNSTYHHGNLRQALLERAIEILSSAGIERLSLRALAREMEVSHAAPLRHFKTKADLLSAIAIEGAQSLMEGVAQARTLPEGTSRLLGISTTYIDWAIQHPAYYQVMRNPDVMRHASETLDEMLGEFGQRQRTEIVRAQSAGWRSEDDPEALFLHLTALTVGTAMIATDPTYPKPSGITPSREELLAPIRRFLNLHDTSKQGE
jgi:AcrR family transcriptional regulator